MANRWQIGDRPVWTYRPVSATGTSTAVEFLVVHPSGTSETFHNGDPEVTGDGTLGWVLTLDTLIAGDEGRWALYATSTAGIAESTSSGFIVEGRPANTPDSCEKWPVLWPQAFDPGAYTPEMLDAVEEAAQAALWARTGQRLGVCTYEESYSPQAGGQGCVVPFKDASGNWHNGYVGAHVPIELRHQPVQSVSAVSVDGVTQQTNSWFVQIGCLWRMEGWPWKASADGPPTVEVVYRAGIPLDSYLQGLVGLAMGELITELLASIGGGPCRLPSKATSVNRQGISVTLGGDVDFGEIGMAACDLLINTVNPHHLTQRSRVYSPEMARVHTYPRS